MRYLLCLAILSLSACGEADEQASASATADVPAGEKIACALGGSDRPVAECAIERSGESLTIRHPDGGFRRFAVTGDRIEAADGAASANVQVIAGNRIEIAVDGDRYRLPAALVGR
jgi:hypothetical protein